MFYFETYYTDILLFCKLLEAGKSIIFDKVQMHQFIKISQLKRIFSKLKLYSQNFETGFY